MPQSPPWRLFRTAAQPPEILPTVEALAERLHALSLHPNTQEPSDIRVYFGQMSVARDGDGHETWPVAIPRIERDGEVIGLGYVATEDQTLDAQAVAEAVLTALVARALAEADHVVFRKAEAA